MDVSHSPFVTSVLPVEGDFAVAYQPFIQVFNEGMNVTVKATLLKDRSCRLDYCNATISKIDGVESVRILDEGMKKAENGKMEYHGVSIQSPNVRTLNLTIPPVTVPEGMSLLLAAPGMFRKESGEGIFLLVTPRRVEHEPEEILTGMNPYEK